MRSVMCRASPRKPEIPKNDDVQSPLGPLQVIDTTKVWREGVSKTNLVVIHAAGLHALLYASVPTFHTGMQASAPLNRTAFRRKGVSEEEWRERRQQERQQEEEQRRALAKFDLKGEVSKPLQRPVMLIDAYNLIHADSELQGYLQVGKHKLGREEGIN